LPSFNYPADKVFPATCQATDETITTNEAKVTTAVVGEVRDVVKEDMAVAEVVENLKTITTRATTTTKEDVETAAMVVAVKKEVTAADVRRVDMEAVVKMTMVLVVSREVIEVVEICLRAESQPP
jgi:hypothetical protein